MAAVLLVIAYIAATASLIWTCWALLFMQPKLMTMALGWMELALIYGAGGENARGSAEGVVLCCVSVTVVFALAWRTWPEGWRPWGQLRRSWLHLRLVVSPRRRPMPSHREP